VSGEQTPEQIPEEAQQPVAQKPEVQKTVEEALEAFKKFAKEMHQLSEQSGEGLKDNVNKLNSDGR